MDETAIKLNQNLRNEVFDDHSELTNLIFANLATHGAPLHYYRVSKFPTSRYAPYTCEQVHSEMLALQRQGLVSIMTWGKQVGFCQPTDKLTSILRAVTTSYAFAEPIILKESKDVEYSPFFGEQRHAEWINYTDTDETRAMRDQLKAYNTFMAAQTVTARGQRYPTSLRRTFNDSTFAHGGRFYDIGSLRYQELSGKGRPDRIPRSDVMINGHETIELDFATLHPTLLHVRAGLPVPDDAYSIGGYSRERIKLAFNVAINASNDAETLASLQEKCGSVRAAESMLSAIKINMPTLAPFLSSGEGVILQRIDSNIAARIMAEFVAARIPVLVVHDSFIVEKGRADMLQNSMIKNFQAELKTDIIPRIK
jgi:hypothetical protein